jgi:glycerophosphoryl diester phosphodiesterase
MRKCLAVSLSILCLPALALEAVCHRGANEVAPENTYAAAKAAIERGAAYIEIDVRPCKDGTLYILHDDTVDRTTNGTGKIADMTPEEVDALDAGSWFSAEFAGEKVPRLDEYVRWIKGKCKVYFDVKDGDIQKIVDLVHELEMEDEVFFWSGKPFMPTRLRQIDPGMPLKMNTHSIEELERVYEHLNPQIIETSLEMAQNPAFTDRCKELGIKIMTYKGGTESSEYIRDVFETPADYINLDALDTFNKIKAERAEE